MMIRLIITLFLAFILTIVPLPSILVQLRPPWILLIMFYLQFYVPRYFSVTLLFMLGLMLDSLLATVIGEHAFTLCMVSWIVHSKAKRFSLFSIGQQMMFISFFAMVYQLLIVLIDSFLGYRAELMSVIDAGLVSALVWPWLRLIGEEFLLSASPKLNMRL